MPLVLFQALFGLCFAFFPIYLLSLTLTLIVWRYPGVTFFNFFITCDLEDGLRMAIMEHGSHSILDQGSISISLRKGGKKWYSCSNQCLIFCRVAITFATELEFEQRTNISSKFISERSEPRPRRRSERSEPRPRQSSSIVYDGEKLG